VATAILVRANGRGVRRRGGVRLGGGLRADGVSLRVENSRLGALRAGLVGLGGRVNHGLLGRVDDRMSVGVGLGLPDGDWVGLFLGGGLVLGARDWLLGGVDVRLSGLVGLPVVGGGGVGHIVSLGGLVGRGGSSTRGLRDAGGGALVTVLTSVAGHGHGRRGEGQDGHEGIHRVEQHVENEGWVGIDEDIN